MVARLKQSLKLNTHTIDKDDLKSHIEVKLKYNYRRIRLMNLVGREVVNLTGLQI